MPTMYFQTLLYNFLPFLAKVYLQLTGMLKNCCFYWRIQPIDVSQTATTLHIFAKWFFFLFSFCHLEGVAWKNILSWAAYCFSNFSVPNQYQRLTWIMIWLRKAEEKCTPFDAPSVSAPSQMSGGTENNPLHELICTCTPSEFW